MKIISDKNNRPKNHKLKNEYWEKEGIEVLSYRLPTGDYVLVNEKVEDMLARKEKRGIEVKMMDFIGTYDRVVDTKYGMQEIYSDIIGKDHYRFTDSLVLAQNNNIKMIVLIEEPGFESVDDVATWRNPRRENWFKYSALHKVGKAKSVKIPKIPPASSEVLMKAMKTIEEKYGVEFRFCDPKDAGARVIELLKGEV